MWVEHPLRLLVIYVLLNIDLQVGLHPEFRSEMVHSLLLFRATRHRLSLPSGCFSGIRNRYIDRFTDQNGALISVRVSKCHRPILEGCRLGLGHVPAHVAEIHWPHQGGVHSISMFTFL